MLNHCRVLVLADEAVTALAVSEAIQAVQGTVVGPVPSVRGAFRCWRRSLASMLR